MGRRPVRLLAERGIAAAHDTGMSNGPARVSRSVTVNATESPLGWLLAHGHVTHRQFDAGERLRADWERAQLAPRVTMAWDARRSPAAVAVRPPSRISAARRSTPSAASTLQSRAPGLVWPISSGAWSAPAKACAKPKP